MTSRERVILSISHKEPDRIPVDLGGTEVSSICKKAYLDLMIYLGFEIGQSEREIHDISVQLPKIDKRLMEWIGVDVMPLFPNPPSAWTRVIVDERNYWSYVDQWGATLSMPKSGHYFDFRKFPLQSSSLKSMEFMNWPDPDDPARTVGLRKRAKELFEMTNYALVGTSLFGGGIFEQPARVRGMEEYFMDCACNVQFADAMMEKITEIYLKATDNYLNEVGEFIQVFCYWDDIAAQDGPFISPSFYRKYIKPKQKRLFDLIRSKTEAKIFLHCCGACYDFIPDFIEIGVDILNPIQVSAKNMDDTAKLKREFGRAIVFWGGGINSQMTLPFGTPQQVRDEVKRRINDLAAGGGFVFNSGHNIQNFVPPENIVAMYEALKENCKY